MFDWQKRFYSLPLFHSFAGMKYVLVTGDNIVQAQMEVMDNNGSTKISSRYPINVDYATGVFTDGKMVVCGGISLRHPRTSACHVYEDGQGWTKLADMATPRDSSASISIPGGILVTGGWNESNRLKTSEIVYLNGTVKQAKPLPEPRYGHCLVEHQGQLIQSCSEQMEQSPFSR